MKAEGGSGRRAARVTGRVREELARSLRARLRDPRLAGAVVTRVEMPDDLQSARVFVRHETRGDDPGARRALLAGLRAAAGVLRREVGQSLGLRYAPELRFLYDEGLDASLRIESLLAEIASERGEGEGEGGGKGGGGEG
ncbi:MAG TPA: 30S ribosome-binding factor RbfA [Polyangiaceae bacterium]|nr:30S ribosome-binding factor RbfA [Polyangiaceae bacterium]